MEYISHEDYKKMMGKFQAEAPKGKLLREGSEEEIGKIVRKPAAHLKAGDVLTNKATVIRGAQSGARTPSGKVDLVVRYPNGKENVVVWGKTTMIGVRTQGEPSKDLEKEGNAFTAGLAKTKKGGEFKVGDKEFKDRTNYDASVSEELDSPYDGGKDDLAAMANDDNREVKFAEKAIEKILGEPVKFVGQDKNQLATYVGSDPRIKYSIDDLGFIYKDNGFTRAKIGKQRISEELEGEAEILGHVKGDIYKVKTPKGEVVDLDFDLEQGDQVDDYGWEGTLYAADDDYEYILPVALVPMGGGDWDVNPYFNEFSAHPFKKKVDEYQFDQMYPDDPGPFEGIEDKLKEFLAKEDDVNWDRMDDEEAKDNETDNGIEEDDDSTSSAPKDYIGVVFSDIKALERKAPEVKIDWDMDDYDNAPIIRGKPSIIEPVIDHYVFKGIDQYGRHWLGYTQTHDEDSKLVAIERDPDADEGDEMEEGINLPSSQPTGPSIQEKRSRLAHLTSEERDQLKQYVETIKTVKEEIKKMVGKTDMEEGGDNTNLIMKPTTVSEDGGSEYEEVESTLDPKIHSAFHKVVGLAVKDLLKAGIEASEIKAFFQQEINELPEFASRQYEG